MTLLPTWGSAFKEGPSVELSHAELHSIDVPMGWAFSARGGCYLPSQGGSESEFNNELVKGSSAVHASPSSALSSINAAYDELKGKMNSVPDWLAEGELDIVEKLSLQRRHSPMWFVLPPAPEKMLPTPEYKRALDALCEFYGSILPRKPLYTWASLDTDPPDTNSGWPMFSNQLPTFISVLGAIRLRFTNPWPSAMEWIEATREMSAQIGAPGSMFTVAVSRRAGPTRKPMPYDFTYGDKTAKTATGYFTRTRLVYMVSRLFNFAISPLSQQVKTCRSLIPGFWHTAENRAFQLSRFKALEDSGHSVYESDFSSYDTTFTPQHRSAIYDGLEKWGFAKQCLDLMRIADTKWEIVTPNPEGPTMGHAAAYSGRFGLLSGMKETTNLDSLHAQAVVLKYMVAKGLTSYEQIRKGKWPLFLNLGDDVLMALPKGVTVDDYASNCKEEGLTARMTAGHRMLMRHIYQGKDYAVAARVVQQTLGNEDSYQHVGHFLLGVAARFAGGVHPVLEDLTRNLVMDGVTGEGHKALVETRCDPKLLMQRPEIADFLRTAQGKSWLMSIMNIDARPNITDLSQLLEGLGVLTPSLLKERNEHLTLLFNQSKPYDKYRTALGNTLIYR